jgi:hypothetical protein
MTMESVIIAALGNVACAVHHFTDSMQSYPIARGLSVIIHRTINNHSRNSMKKTVLIASLLAAVALSACGKKEEVAAPAATPAPAATAPAATAPEATAPAAAPAAAADAAAAQAASAASEAASAAASAASAASDAASAAAAAK